MTPTSMKTYSFIGSDKNAGKTTAFKAVYRQMQDGHGAGDLCITSIGINGEDRDSYEGRQKPTIEIFKETCFITNGEHLKRHTGKYQTLAAFSEPDFSRTYILGRCLTNFPVVLEGPNTGREIRLIKETLARYFSAGATLLIDGSIDRQFLASPEISDGFYFAVLFSGRAPQRQKVRDFLFALSIPTCSEEVARKISPQIRKGSKSILLDETGRTLYRGDRMPCTDGDLLLACQGNRTSRCILYINGAFTASLHEALAGYERFEVILDNFSQYMNITTQEINISRFKPFLYLFNPVRIQGLYINQETDFDPSLLPTDVPAINLFRTDLHETRT